jgi:cysteine desulfurase
MIYLDNNATTPLLNEVLSSMLPCFDTHFGNASSKTHAWGWQADELVKQARIKMADSIGAEPSEIYFTSGATESIQLALNIIAENYVSKGKHIISCHTEHKAMLDVLEKLIRQGFEITLLPVNKEGVINLSALKDSIRTDTIAVSIMHANNETGLLHPVDEIGKICVEKQVIFLSDCTQSFGKISVEVKAMQVGMACFSAHKFYGPKGVGALYISRRNPRVALQASKTDGAQESGLRAGTINVPGIVGMGEAARLASNNLNTRKAHLSFLRNTFEKTLEEHFRIRIHCKDQDRLPNTSNICFLDFENTTLIKKLPELAFSTGSACTSANAAPSHVLQAMKAKAQNTVRFSFGIQNTEAEIDQAISYIKKQLLQ